MTGLEFHPDKKLTFPQNTIGYHHYHACAVFGETSKAVKWLEKKATESPNGMNERVVAEESQVVQLLGAIHLREWPFDK